MSIVDELIALLGFEVTGEDEARRFEDRIDGLNKRIDKFATNAGRLAGAASLAVAGAFGVLGRSVVDTSAQFEAYQATLETIEGSAEKARASLDWIADFGKTTPYDVAQVTEAFVALKAYGIDPIANDALRTLGDTASAMGKPLTQAVEAFADAATGEFERLKEFGIRAQQQGDEVTFSWTKNGEEMTRTIQKNSNDIRAFLLETMGDRFSGAMDRQSRTWNGMMSNLGDTWTDFKRRIGEAGFFNVMTSNLQGVLDYLGRLDADGTLDRWAQNLSNVLSTGAEIIGVIVNRIATHVNFIIENFDTLQPVVTAIGVALGGLMIYAFPLIATFAAIALAVDDFLTYLQGGESVIGSVIEWFKRLPEAISEMASSFTNFVSEIDWFEAGQSVGEFIGDGLVTMIEHYIELMKFIWLELPGKIVGFLIDVDWAAIGSAWLAGLRAQMEFLIGIMAGIGARMGEALFEGLQSVGAAIRDWFTGLIPDWARDWFSDGASETRPQTTNQRIADEDQAFAVPVPHNPNRHFSSATAQAIDPAQAERIMAMLERNRALSERIAGNGAVDATLNDSRSDNRQFPMTNNVTVNQNVTTATDAPRRAANATGDAVVGAIPTQRAQAEMEPSF